MKLCMGCMNQIEDNVQTCPYCGFNEHTLRQESYYLIPGTIVGGKYIVGRVVSYGGYTVSYLGFDAEANRKVIVKEYLPSDFSTRSEGEKKVTIYSGDAQEQFEQGLTNFLNEANRIQHLTDTQGIEKVYDCLAENDTGYVISEYLDGKTLKEILDSGKTYTPEEARDFIIEILKGLRKVHPLDIIHCDIAPENIIVTAGGEIKLLNFGATRYVTTANSKSLAIILKQGYAPEEQYRSKGIRGPWTDVYALAAVMYRMITGRVPQESVDRALDDTLREPSKLGIKIPENIENALMNALNVYAGDRTQSADAFLKELTSPSVKRRKVKKRKETGKFPLWTKVLVACVVCVVVVGGVAFYQIRSASRNVGNNKGAYVACPAFTDRTIKDAQTRVKDINDSNEGWKIRVKEKKDFQFDKDPEKNGTIAWQSVETGTTLNTEDIAQKTDGALQYKDGKVTGTIYVCTYTDKKIHYGDIAGMNAYQIKETIGIGSSHFRKVSDKKEEKTYYDLDYIKTADGKKITASALNRGKDSQKVLNCRGLDIYYYATYFFYFKGSLPDFKGKMIDSLRPYPTYVMTDETHRKATGKKKSLKGTTLADSSYYTFSEDFRKGEIVSQTVPAGTENLDTHDNARIRKSNGVLLHVIRKVIPYKGLTGAQVRKKAEAIPGVKTHLTGSGSASDKVKSVSIRANGESKRYFRRGENVDIYIETRAEKTVSQPSAPASGSGNSGRSAVSGPSTGGSSSRGSSSGGNSSGSHSGGSGSGRRGSGRQNNSRGSGGSGSSTGHNGSSSLSGGGSGNGSHSGGDLQ